MSDTKDLTDRVVVEEMIEKGKLRQAFEAMWFLWDGAEPCPTCGLANHHDKYFTLNEEQTERVGVNPEVDECWRMDLTEEHKLYRVPA